MKLRIPLRVLVLAGFAILAALFLTDEKNRAVFENGGVGAAFSGHKFGVQIGDSIAVASVHLRDNGFGQEPYDDQAPPICGYRATIPSDRVHEFSDRSWRRGLVCVVEREGHVAWMGWIYQPTAP